MAKVNFTICTETQYSNLNPPTSGTFYYVVADGQVSTPDSSENTVHKLYIGTKLIGSGLTLDEVIYALEHNEYVFPGVTAGDITPKSDEPIDMSSYFDIQTTGGDNDLKSGPGKLKSITGSIFDITDSTGEGTAANSGTISSGHHLAVFNPGSYNSTRMNLIDTTKYLTSGGNYYYYFPVTRGAWGLYQTTQENNGYIAVGTTPVSVKFLAGANAPASASDGVTCPVANHTTNSDIPEGKTYYVPDGKGWLIVGYSGQLQSESGTDGNTITLGGVETGVHIAWSNYNDSVAGTAGVSTIDISTAVSSVHSWGLAGIIGVTRSVVDEITFKDGSTNGSWYRRVARKLMSGSVTGETTLTWTKIQDAEEGDIYTTTITDMVEDGLWVADTDASISVSEQTVTLSVSHGTDISTLLGGKYIYHELDGGGTGSNTGSVTVSGEIAHANDFGLTYFLTSGGTLTVPVKAWVEESFQQSGKDQIFNNITYVKTLAEVVATALCELDDRLKPIEDGLENGFQYLQVTDLVVENINGAPYQATVWIDF